MLTTHLVKKKTCYNYGCKSFLGSIVWQSPSTILDWQDDVILNLTLVIEN